MSGGEHSILIYIAKRLLQMVPLILGIILFSFVLVHISPGDPLRQLVGESEWASPEFIEAARKAYGLDRPIWEQLWIYVTKVLQGDFGYSYFFNRPVMDVILERLPLTVLLGASTLVFSITIGILFGVYSSRKPYSLDDNVISTVSLLGFSIPSFWLGMMLIVLFSVQLGWLPSSGYRGFGEGTGGVVDILMHLVLPTATLGTGFLALIARMTRTNMIQALSEDYILTARAKGLSKRAVLFKHALKNALLPVVTVIGTQFRVLIMGAALTETVFSWPGLGRLIYDSLMARDYPILMGSFIIASILVAISNLVVDIMYAYLDPRIRYR